MPKARVLVVDDSALMREMLTDILRRDPAIEVVGVAVDPVVAWERIKLARPDVVTLDVEMPRMDGLTFLEMLMTHHPMPVVMVSSMTERGCNTTLRALELGAVDFVTKPRIDVVSGTVTDDTVVVGLNRAKLNGAMIARLQGKNTMTVTISVKVDNTMVPVIGMNLNRETDEIAVGSVD